MMREIKKYIKFALTGGIVFVRKTFVYVSTTTGMGTIG